MLTDVLPDAHTQKSSRQQAPRPLAASDSESAAAVQDDRGRRLTANTPSTGFQNATVNSTTIFDGCIDEKSFTPIKFDLSTLRTSNLGGMGGRCDTAPDQCDFPRNASTPREVYVSNVGKTRFGSQIDIRVTNETEYRAWRVGPNGLKRQRSSPGSEVSGYFLVINLLGPREPTQGFYWNDAFTFVQLRYEFIKADTGSPIEVDRTFLTFCTQGEIEGGP
jgi:hypothetical protein